MSKVKNLDPYPLMDQEANQHLTSAGTPAVLVPVIPLSLLGIRIPSYGVRTLLFSLILIRFSSGHGFICGQLKISFYLTEMHLLRI
jgi:hypothetical protein